MVKPRELSVCVQVLDVHVEPDFLHLSWEVQVLVYFSDPSLKGVPEQTTGTSGKVFGSTRKRKKKGSKKAGETLSYGSASAMTGVRYDVFYQHRTDKKSSVDPFCFR